MNACILLFCFCFSLQKDWYQAIQECCQIWKTETPEAGQSVSTWSFSEPRLICAVPFFFCRCREKLFYYFQLHILFSTVSSLYRVKETKWDLGRKKKKTKTDTGNLFSSYSWWIKNKSRDEITGFKILQSLKSKLKNNCKSKTSNSLMEN